MRSKTPIVKTTILLLTLLCPMIRGASPVTNRIDLRLLYAGRPDSERQRDFITGLL